MKYTPRNPGFSQDNIKDHYLEDPETGCWNWTRAKYKTGYGSKGVKGKIYYAHRLSFELHFGPIPEGKVIMHLCDNRACINPAHLRCDTQQANLLDAEIKGRMNRLQNRPRGEVHPMRILNEEQVRLIRTLYSQGFSQSVLAERYHMAQTSMSAICRRRTWKHVH
jgi:hypothetical protein